MAPQLADFLGDWHLAREILQADGGHAHFTGQARFTPLAAGRLRYHEEGLLCLPGMAPMLAERSYLWAAEAGEGAGEGAGEEGAGEAIAVFFADGRPFHRFTPARLEAAHFCPPDHYRVAYDFRRWPEWSACWQVSGPRKAYCLTSRYCRA